MAEGRDLGLFWRLQFSTKKLKEMDSTKALRNFDSSPSAGLHIYIFLIVGKNSSSLQFAIYPIVF